MSDVTFVTSRVIAMDGVTYTISVYSKPSGFFAFWECRNCGNQAAPPMSAETREEAIRQCEELIELHHNVCHRVVQAVV